MRERGSKQEEHYYSRAGARSLLVRERGSKHPMTIMRRLAPGVAPRAGARIETALGDASVVAQGSLLVRERGSKHEGCLNHVERNQVAPRAGARIETPSGFRRRSSSRSLLVRERGSKRRQGSAAGRAPGRSSCGSADRNLNQGTNNTIGRMSLLVRERGSKQQHPGRAYQADWSLLVRERGSKRPSAYAQMYQCFSVAPRAGARIETAGRAEPNKERCDHVSIRAPARGATCLRSHRCRRWRSPRLASLR